MPTRLVAHLIGGWNNAHLMRRVETVLLILAAGFYFWFLSHFGLHEVVGYLRLAGWGIALTISLEAVARIANTCGWRVTITERPPALSFAETFAARIAGEAVDYTTPSAQLGGQFVTALMVRHKLPLPKGLASVAVAALAEAAGQIAFIAVALLLSLRLLKSAEALMWPIAGGFVLAVALAAAFFAVQMKRPFSYLWRAATKLEIPQAMRPEIRDSAHDADTQLLEFYAHHRPRFAISCAAYLTAWSLGPVEIWILLRLLHQPASWQIALAVEGLGLLIERATFLIPAKLVSQEGGKALILAMLGYPAQIGFAIGLLRRIKEMVWVGFGLGAFALYRTNMDSPAKSADLVAPAAQAGDILKMQQAQGEQSL